jgi:hypothetical protein
LSYIFEWQDRGEDIRSKKKALWLNYSEKKAKKHGISQGKGTKMEDFGVKKRRHIVLENPQLSYIFTPIELHLKGK